MLEAVCYTYSLSMNLQKTKVLGNKLLLSTLYKTLNASDTIVSVKLLKACEILFFPFFEAEPPTTSRKTARIILLGLSSLKDLGLLAFTSHEFVGWPDPRVNHFPVITTSYLPKEHCTQVMGAPLLKWRRHHSSSEAHARQLLFEQDTDFAKLMRDSGDHDILLRATQDDTHRTRALARERENKG